MEIEYKWDLLEAPRDTVLQLITSDLVMPFAQPCESRRMHALYYDTADGQLSERRSSLRLRQEGDESVCCMKLPAQGADGIKVREEHEVEAVDIRSGLEALAQAGAPQELCAQLLDAELVVTCETDFVRESRLLAVHDTSGEVVMGIASDPGYTLFTCELAVDQGALRHEGREAPLHELELEFKDGDIKLFHAYAKKLQEAFALVEQPLSKIARALNV